MGFSGFSGAETKVLASGQDNSSAGTIAGFQTGVGDETRSVDANINLQSFDGAAQDFDVISAWGDGDLSGGTFDRAATAFTVFPFWDQSNGEWVIRVEYPDNFGATITWKLIEK